MRSFTPRRRGFSLVELLISMVLIGLLGVAITRLLMTESRLFDIQRARREARAVGRSSMNILFSDLRMVNDGASAPGSVLLASPETLKVRVPYAFGVACGVGASTVTVSLLPADSSVRYMASYAGYAWRSRLTNTYTYVPLGVSTNMPVISTAPTTCTTTANIKVDTTNGRSWPIIDLKPASVAAQPGTPVFIYQEVMYWFAQSTAYPQAGQMGLYRQATGRAAEELVAPFDASARFKFYVRNADTPTLTPPATLDSLVGVAIVLNGSSPTKTVTQSPVKTKMETSVFFRNRRVF
jgi:prepilin-type N-terminal cleavage/methylation domain-containing protein